MTMCLHANYNSMKKKKKWQCIPVASVAVLRGELPRSLSGKESITCQCRRCGFYLWVGKIPWRRKWQPTAVLLPGKSHGQRSLVGCSPWGCKESAMTKHMCMHGELGELPSAFQTEFLNHSCHLWLWISLGRKERGRKGDILKDDPKKNVLILRTTVLNQSRQNCLKRTNFKFPLTYIVSRNKAFTPRWKMLIGRRRNYFFCSFVF